MTNLKRYDKYKDSGVEWLGEIPEHWEIDKSKRYHSVFKVINNMNQCENVLSLTLRGVVRNNIDNPEGLIPKDYRTYQLFEKNDLVFKLIDLENISTSRVGLVPEKGIMSSAYIRLIPGKNFNSKYIYYYFYSLYLNQVYNNIGQGVRSTLNPTDLLNIPSIAPKNSEQTAIANFLDEKCEKIDRAVTQKEKLIELLKERKQILIQNAVTKGLDPNVKMKDSGVEWIEEIPEHWEIKRLRLLGKTQNGISAGAEYFGYGFPFISYGDVYKNRVLPITGSSLANSPEEDRMQYSVKDGDIFFTRTSETIEEIGMSSVCHHTIKDATFSGFLIRFRPNNNELSKLYSEFFFSSQMHRAYFVREMNLVTRASLSQELLKDLPVFLPPIDEQLLIAKYLTTVQDKMNEALEYQNNQILKLKEYKSTLINSAVTGKIKVV